MRRLLLVAARLSLFAFVAVALYGTVHYAGGIVRTGGPLPAAGGALAAAGVLGLAFWAARLPARIVVPAAVLLAFALRAAWILAVPTEPVYDFLTLSQAARAVAVGDLSPFRETYFTLWTYQVPFVLYEAALYRLFGADDMVLKWANVVVLALHPAVVYALGRSLERAIGRVDGTPFGRDFDRAVGAPVDRSFDRAAYGVFGDADGNGRLRPAAGHPSAANAAALITAVYPSTIMMSSVLTNQHLADLLLFGGLAVWLRVWSAVCIRVWSSARSRVECPRPAFLPLLVAGTAGALVGAGHLIRPLGAVWVAAVVVYAFFTLFIRFPSEGYGSSGQRSTGRDSACRMSAERKFVGRKSSGRPIVPVFGRRSWAALFAFFIGFWAVTDGTGALLKSAGVIDRPLGNHDPLWKFVAGLNRETIGHFSRDDYTAVMTLPLGPERTALEQALIAERFKAPGLLSFFLAKASYLWGFADQAPNWSGWTPEPQALAFALAFERSLFASLAFGIAVFAVIAGSSRTRPLMLACTRPVMRRAEALPFGDPIGDRAERSGEGLKCEGIDKCDEIDKYEEESCITDAWLLPALVLLGYAMIHLVIEIQVRYRYDMLPAIIVLGLGGWSSLSQFRHVIFGRIRAG